MSPPCRPPVARGNRGGLAPARALPLDAQEASLPPEGAASAGVFACTAGFKCSFSLHRCLTRQLRWSLINTDLIMSPSLSMMTTVKSKPVTTVCGGLCDLVLVFGLGPFMLHLAAFWAFLRIPRSTRCLLLQAISSAREALPSILSSGLSFLRPLWPQGNSLAQSAAL